MSSAEVDTGSLLASSVRAETTLLGTSPATTDLHRVITQVAPTEAPVLVLGDEGSGKELVARMIHERSGRGGAFVSVSCGARGDVELARAFAGDDVRPGLFDAAHQGTLFLNDIDALGARAQGLLLRALEERAVRVGAMTKRAEFRLVTATRGDLGALSAEGRFREELLVRLQVVTIQVPPLAARREDLPALVAHFVEHYAMRFERAPPTVSVEALDALLRHPWPGNLPQLARTIERAVRAARGDVLGVAELDFDARDDGSDDPVAPAQSGAWPTLAAVERRYIDRVLTHTGGNKTRAAELLGIDRRTLSRLFARERVGAAQK